MRSALPIIGIKGSLRTRPDALEKISTQYLDR